MTDSESRYLDEARQLRRTVPATREGVTGVAASIAALADAAWARLLRRARVPFVAQSEPRDCAAACLAMVLGYHGLPPADDLSDRLGIGRDGVRVRTLIAVGTELRLGPRGISVPAERLGELPAGTILHVDGNHFVVIARAARRGQVLVNDPAAGPLTLTVAELAARATGIAVLFEPPRRGVTTRGKTMPLWQVARLVTQPERHRRAWARTLILSGAVQSLGLAVPVVTRLAVDHWSHGQTRTSDIVVAVAGFTIACFAVSVTRTLALVSLQSSVERDVTLRLVTHALSLPYRWFQSRDPGDLLMRLRSAAVVREMLSTIVTVGALDGAAAGVFLALLVAQDPVLALVAGVCAAIQVLLAIGAASRVLRATRTSLAAQSRSQSEMLQFLNGAQTVKIAASEQAVLDRWRPVYHDELRFELVRQRFVAVCLAVVGSLRTMTPLAVLGFGVQRVQAGELTLGGLMAASALAVGFVAPLGSLVGTTVALPLLRGHLDRMAEVLRATPDESGDRALDGFRGGVLVEEVTFRYARHSPDVLRNVTVDISPGEKIAVVGASGSGKSTLALVLAGLHRPYAGRVLLDGTDITELETRSVRHSIAVVTQDAYVFAGTIRENLRVEAGTSDDAALDRACRLAAFDTVVANLPMGYDTRVDSGGSMLSGGQRQRLLLARALAVPRPLVVLDEATSALDAHTERSIMERLVATPATVVFVAHRLSTVRFADRVLVMEDGQVVESGRPDELLDGDGAFARLVEDQSSGRPHARAEA